MSVVIWIGYIVILELLEVFIPKSLARKSRKNENPIDHSLIGSIGRIVDISSNQSAEFRVRIGIELWSAKFVSKTAQLLPIGMMVRVIAVNGMLLHVEEYSPD